MSDKEIIRKLLAGDQEAMKDLIDKYQDLVINTCFQVLHNPDDAYDVAQEVFIQAYRKIGMLRNENRLSFWLYRMALNTSINLRKKNQLFSFLRLDNHSDSRESHEFAHKDTDPDPHETFEIKEKQRCLQLMLKKLPSRQQKAFILHHYEQLSYKEIAGVLKAPVSTVESLIFRAKSRLRTLCSAWYEEKK